MNAPKKEVRLGCPTLDADTAASPTHKLHSGVSLIEVSDPLVLTEIENDPSLQPFLGQRLSDRCVAILPDAIPQVVRRLQALGHMPRVIE